MSKDRKRWLPEEDKVVLDEVSKVPSGQRIKWQRIADKIVGTTGTQCSERYHGVIDPKLKHGKLTQDEMNYIEANYKISTVAIIANYLHRPRHQIRHHIQKIKFKDSTESSIIIEEFIEEEEEEEEEEDDEEEVSAIDQLAEQMINLTNIVNMLIQEFNVEKEARIQLTQELQNEKEARMKLESKFKSYEDTMEFYKWTDENLI